MVLKKSVVGVISRPGLLAASYVSPSGGCQTRWCRRSEKPHQSLEVLRRRCQEELLPNEFDSTWAKRRNPIWFFSSANNASTFFLCRCALANASVLTNSRARCRAGSC